MTDSAQMQELPENGETPDVPDVPSIPGHQAPDTAPTGVSEALEGGAASEGAERTPPRDRGQGRRPSRRVAFADLTPDRQSEIEGRRQAAATARRHRYRPAMPTVNEDVELHMPAVILLYEEHFRPVNEYAVALDEVARERLADRADYNRYLQEFDAYIAELKASVSGDQDALERASSGGTTSSPRPFREQAAIQSNRSMQMLRIFEAADVLLRHATFLSIYGDDAGAVEDAERKIVRGVRRCVKKLRQVKHRAFRQIIEERQLDVKHHDKMRLSEVMRIGEANEEKARQRVRSRDDRPDPAAPALSRLSDATQPPGEGA